jgi:hypothetical protein
MSSYYAVISGIIFAGVSIIHLAGLIKGWSVRIESFSVPMAVSWFGLPVSASLAIWGLTQFGH